MATRALVKLSPTLCKVLETPAEMTRPNVTKAVWAYIKRHELQKDAAKKSIITLDDGLKSVFGSGLASIKHTDILKLVQPHLTPAAPPAGAAAAAPAERA